MFIKTGVFTINDHAYVVTVKDSHSQEIDIEWFSYICEKYTHNCVTSKDSNGTFSKEMFLKERIDIIDYEMQKKIVEKKRELKEIYFRLKKFSSLKGVKFQ